jgi:hypothetical protein
MQIRWQRGWLALSVVALAAMLTPAVSEASSTPARFVFEQCDSALPAGGVPASWWSANPTAAYAPFQNCAAPGGAIGIVETGTVSTQFALLDVAVPETPGGFVEAETISAAGNFYDGNSHVYENGFPTSGAGLLQRNFHIHAERNFFSNGGGFVIAMTCSTSCPAGSWIAANYIAATEVDPKAPKVAGVAGSLLGGGVVRGHQTLAAEASDEGGGLSNLSVLANGLPAAAPVLGSCNVFNVSNPSVYGAVAASPTPCPGALKAGWTLDTQAYPFHDGANNVEVCASDYASLGNPNTTCSAPHSVEVDNSCTESPVPGGEVLSAQFAGSDRDTITVAYGKGAVLSGELDDNAGDAISGATICVKSQTLGLQSKPQPVSIVKTDAEGRFDYEVPAGPNREIVIGYRHDSSQVARSVRFYAHAKPSLHVSPSHLKDGSRIHLWGKVPAPAAAGRVVILQANVPGSKRWITFRRATSAAHGDFRSGYRFTSTTRTTAYRFRAVVPSQDDYPWVEGHSKPVKVVVHG